MTSPRLLPKIAAASALALAAGMVVSTGAAWADNPLAPKTNFNLVINPADGSVTAPADGESIPNIDSDKATIRAYYNATNGIADKTSSRYISQVHGIENQLLKSLPAQHANNAAVVFDVDDTLLWTYDYTDHTSNFNYDPTTNAQAVAAGFPAVPGMPALLQTLKARGYAIYGITGRPSTQETDTLNNLDNQRFTTDGSTNPANALFNSANLYTKDNPLPGYVNCSADGDATKCSTVEYKAFTRQHIENGGTVDIVMNVGDQWSDLQGGFADDWTKIPNPTYFLSSPDIAGAPASDANMVPPTSYVMAADGSSGYSVTTGDDIPNFDLVRADVRDYYKAVSGIANKTASPYISQLAGLESTWTTQVSSDCASSSQVYNAAADKKAAAKKAVKKAKHRKHKSAKQVAKAKKQLARARTAAARKAALEHLAKASHKLKKRKAKLAKAKKKLAAITLPPAPAVVFDADDTTLWTYDQEDGVMHFNYNPATANAAVAAHAYPAVPGMVSVVKAAAASGCNVFGLTGRPASQQADTIANLTEKGYVSSANQPLFTTAHYFTKDVANQPWVDCGPDRSCSTVEYKSGTRAHIESLGFHIVGNFGDQYSDLLGGYADHVYKLPNPTYYLP